MDKDLKLNCFELLKASRENFIKNFGEDVYKLGADWVYADLEELFSATDSPAVDVEDIVTEIYNSNGFCEISSDVSIKDIFSILRTAIDHLASRNLIRGAIPDDMVLVPRELTDEMCNGALHAIELGTLHDVWEALIKAYEEGK